MIRSLIAAVLSIAVMACGDTIVNMPTTPTPPTTTPPAGPVRATMEFRVQGNASSVRVRFATPADGLAQTITTLPYFTSFTTTADNMFLSLEVTPISYSFAVLHPFLSAQILVNSVLFREATSNEFMLNTISVSGTWRR